MTLSDKLRWKVPVPEEVLKQTTAAPKQPGRVDAVLSMEPRLKSVSTQCSEPLPAVGAPACRRCRAASCSSAIGPPAGRPSEAAEPGQAETSRADMRRPSRRTASRRAFSAGSTAWKWSSRNSIVATTMSPRRDVGAGSARAPSGRSAHSDAACTRSDRPGSSRRSVAAARADGARQVGVHRHDDDAHRRAVSGRSALWHRRGSPL